MGIKGMFPGMFAMEVEAWREFNEAERLERLLWEHKGFGQTVRIPHSEVWDKIPHEEDIMEDAEGVEESGRIRSITIEQTDNKGYVVQVGCRKLAYGSGEPERGMLLKDIEEYLENPLKKREKMGW